MRRNCDCNCDRGMHALPCELKGVQAGRRGGNGMQQLHDSCCCVAGKWLPPTHPPAHPPMQLWHGCVVIKFHVGSNAEGSNACRITESPLDTEIDYKHTQPHALPSAIMTNDNNCTVQAATPPRPPCPALPVWHPTALQTGRHQQHTRVEVGFITCTRVWCLVLAVSSDRLDSPSALHAQYQHVQRGLYNMYSEGRC